MRSGRSNSPAWTAASSPPRRCAGACTWTATIPALLRGLPAVALARRLEAVVAAGRGLGLRDLRAFCLLGALMLRFGPGVADHPELRRAVAAARSPDQGLLWLPATLEDGAWAGIARAAGRWDGAG